MTTTVKYNGSRFAGSKHASIASLLELIELEPLDWETFGNFVQIYPEGMINIHGNFERIAHAFSIVTDDKDILASFAAAIDANHRLCKYRDKLPETPSPRALELMRDASVEIERPTPCPHS